MTSIFVSLHTGTCFFLVMFSLLFLFIINTITCMCFKTLSVWNCMLKSMQKINFMVNLCRCHLFLRNTIIVLFLKFITPKCHVNYLMFFRDIYMYLKYESLIVPLDWDLFKIGGWKRDWREDSTFYHGYISKGHLESSDGGNSCRTYPLDLPLNLYHSLFSQCPVEQTIISYIYVPVHVLPNLYQYFF